MTPTRQPAPAAEAAVQAHPDVLAPPPAAEVETAVVALCRAVLAEAPEPPVPVGEPPAHGDAGHRV